MSASFEKVLEAITSKEVLDKVAKRKYPIKYFHATELAYFFAIEGSSGIHGVQIWKDGRMICSCAAFFYKATLVCSHIVVALKALVIWAGEEEVLEIIRKHLFGGAMVCS
jgi:hypothetical protein